jgi:hypothetical protein
MVNFGVIICYRNVLTEIREEHGLKMFGNRVLRRIFGPKREDVVGG